MTAITLNQLTKRFGETSVLTDLSLAINNGEFLVVVGPSGCGKSTVLRLIAGLEDPTEGDVAFDESSIVDISPKDRDLAMVFQNYALYPHMTVFDNMAFGLKMRGVDKATIHQRVTDTATLLELGELLKRKPKQLSGGQRQRVALGRAIVRQPKAFLMDEPLSNLDAKLRVTTRKELRALHQRLGITTIYVTHDQEEAMTLGQRIAVLHDGVLQQCDTPQDVYHQPANLFVAGFIGQFNHLPLEKTDNHWTVAAQAVSLPNIGQLPEQLTIGFRPEDALPDGDYGDCLTLTGQATAVEFLGGHQQVSVAVNGAPKPLIIHWPVEKAVTIGEKLTFTIPNQRLHWFGGDKNQRLIINEVR